MTQALPSPMLMLRYTLFTFFIAGLLMFPFTKAKAEAQKGSAYDYSFTTLVGEEKLPLSQFKGKVVLVVNTASQCGFTPQYEGLQKLYDTYKDKGFVVLGVPANDFGGQEPGSSSEIAIFS
jgi:glutathione peroxidase